MVHSGCSGGDDILSLACGRPRADARAVTSRGLFLFLLVFELLIGSRNHRSDLPKIVQSTVKLRQRSGTLSVGSRRPDIIHCFMSVILFACAIRFPNLTRQCRPNPVDDTQASRLPSQRSV
jgi:hypothetical protein